MSVYVGIDVHRKRSQVAVVNEGGEVLASRNVPNGVRPVLSVIGGLPAGTPAAYEAAFGWGWLLELLEGYGFEPHMVHPLQCKAIASARLKNDKAGAAILAQLLRADLLPEAWIAPPEVRQLRAVPRRRAQLVRLRTLLRNRVHAVLAGHGHGRPAGCWSGPGRAWLASLELPAVSREVIGDALALMDALQVPVDRLDAEVRPDTFGDRRRRTVNTPSPDEAPSERPDVYTADEAAVILKCTADWLKRRATARKIPFTMLGGSYRFSNAHLKEIIRLNEHLPAERARQALSASAVAARPRHTRRDSQEAPIDADITPLRARPRPDGPRSRKKNAA
jgi:excisionase family DNA binding protein